MRTAHFYIINFFFCVKFNVKLFTKFKSVRENIYYFQQQKLKSLQNIIYYNDLKIVKIISLEIYKSSSSPLSQPLRFYSIHN